MVVVRSIKHLTFIVIIRDGHHCVGGFNQRDLRRYTTCPQDDSIKTAIYALPLGHVTQSMNSFLLI